MSVAGLQLPPLFHVGIVVADLDVAERNFGNALGLTRERQMDVQVQDAMFRGTRVDFSARYVFLALGNTELELIAPLEGESPYTEFLAQHGEGVHHLACVVDSIDTQLARLGAGSPDCSVMLDATVPDPGVRFVYVESSAHGAMLEFVQIGGQDVG